MFDEVYSLEEANINEEKPVEDDDSVGSLYARLTRMTEKRLRESGLHMLDPREGETILEIGFGSGVSLVPLALSVGETGMIFGIDISARMYCEAEKLLGKAGISDRVKLLCADACRLPYGDNSFNAQLMIFTLETFEHPEIQLCLLECLRTLVPGGRLCVVALSDQGNPGTIEKIYQWSNKRFSSYVNCRPIPVLEYIGKAGFRVKDSVLTTTWGLPVEIVLGIKP